MAKATALHLRRGKRGGVGRETAGVLPTQAGAARLRPSLLPPRRRYLPFVVCGTLALLVLTVRWIISEDPKVTIRYLYSKHKPDERNSIVLDLLKDIQLGSLKGQGETVMVFNVRIPKIDPSKEFVMKISGEDELFDTFKEIEAFHILNMQPTLASIPKLVWSREVTGNPYATWEYQQLETHLIQRGVPHDDIAWLHHQKEIGILVMPLIPHTGIPDAQNLAELSRFLRSLLQALDLAHSRRVMNNDLALRNVMYDNRTGTTYLYDWNDMRLFEGPNLVGLNPFVSMHPPEADGIPLPTHATVSAFDIYCVGLLLNEILCDEDYCDAPPPDAPAKLRLVHELAHVMLTKDPFMRPGAAQLLQHDFVRV